MNTNTVDSTSSLLPSFTHLHNITFNGVQIVCDILDPATGKSKGKGGGIIATEDHGSGEILITVPNSLILNRETVEETSKGDVVLREILIALEDGDGQELRPGERWKTTSRLKVMVLLLVQMTLSTADHSESRQSKSKPVSGPWTDYMKLLPQEIPLPTFYSEAERELLEGTSLADALEQKLSSLRREYDDLRAKTEKVLWCRKNWWTAGDKDDMDEDFYPLMEPSNIGPPDWLTFEHYKLSDALYRSRAFEVPRGIGDSMVPVVDMANHLADNMHNARFEVNDELSVMLVVRDGREIKKGDEVNIIYGAGGACEMIFSYGFVDDTADSARELFLSLTIPSDDPLKRAKTIFAKEAPGVRIFVDEKGEVKWESDFVWWACVNEEDGLEFEILQSVDGQKELNALWRGDKLDASKLQGRLLSDQLGDVFRLRALVLVQDRIELQGEGLSSSQSSFDQAVVDETHIQSSVYRTVSKLRELELDLLTSAYHRLEMEKGQLSKLPVIQQYLRRSDNPTQAEMEETDEFS